MIGLRAWVSQFRGLKDWRVWRFAKGAGLIIGLRACV